MNNKKSLYSFLAGLLLLCSMEAQAATEYVAIEIEPELYLIENSPRRVFWQEDELKYRRKAKIKGIVSSALVLASAGLFAFGFEANTPMQFGAFSIGSIVPSYYAVKLALQSQSNYEKATCRKKALEFEKEKYSRVSRALEKEQKEEKWLENGAELDAHLPQALKETVLDYCKEDSFFLHVITFHKPNLFFNKEKDRTIKLKSLEVELENDEACLTTTNGSKFLFGTNCSRTNAIYPNRLYSDKGLVGYAITRSSVSPFNS